MATCQFNFHTLVESSEKLLVELESSIGRCVMASPGGGGGRGGGGRSAQAAAEGAVLPEAPRAGARNW